jgi:hypothetical protein
MQAARLLTVIKTANKYLCAAQNSERSFDAQRLGEHSAEFRWPFQLGTK